MVGRAGVAATSMDGAVFYLRDTAAFIPALGLAGFGLAYDVAILFALLRKQDMAAFLVGFALDNLVLVAGWWVVASAQAGALQTNDMYLILFPVLVFGVVRLGWILGAVYTALWLGYMAWIFLRYFPPQAYSVQQLPLRLLFMSITVGVVLYLMSRLSSEQRRSETLLGEVQKQARELAERNLDLEAMDRLRQNLLLTIAHELKTPITVIKATAEMLEVQNKAGDDVRGRLLRGLNSGVERLECLIGDALDYTAIQGGALKLELQTADVAGICREALTRAKPLLTAKGQKLDVEIPESAPDVWMDPRRCEQVFRNLIAHASASTSSGETIAVKLTISPTSVLTSVADSGPAIAEGDFAKVFLPFYRSGEPDGKGSGESGLGLALAWRLVEMHQGKLWVESKAPKGNTFFLALPRADASGPAKMTKE